MKMNIELIRDILLYVNNHDEGYVQNIQESLGHHPFKDVAYHVNLLVKENYLTSLIRKAYYERGYPVWTDIGMSLSGHEFVDIVEDEAVWIEFKKIIAEKEAKTTISLIEYLHSARYMQERKFDITYIEGDQHNNISKDQINIEQSGDFRGAFVNIKSSLTNTTQTINNAQNLDDADKETLTQLISELENALQGVPKENSEDAEAVSESAKMLIETISEEQPNKARIKITKDGLQKAATNILSIAPTVTLIVARIIETVNKLRG